MACDGLSPRARRPTGWRPSTWSMPKAGRRWLNPARAISSQSAAMARCNALREIPGSGWASAAAAIFAKPAQRGDGVGVGLKVLVNHQPLSAFRRNPCTIVDWPSACEIVWRRNRGCGTIARHRIASACHAHLRQREAAMAEAILTISSKNYSSWSLRGWLLCQHGRAGLRRAGCAGRRPGEPRRTACCCRRRSWCRA